MFRQLKRKDDNLDKDLKTLHDKYYKTVRGSKRDLEKNLEELALGEYGDCGGPVMGKKIKNRIRMTERIPVPIVSITEKNASKPNEAATSMLGKTPKTHRNA